MGTTWEQVETAAMTYIKNDISLNNDLQNRLPVFYNRMAAYMRAGMAKFNRPPEMQTTLSDVTEPDFDSFAYAPEDDIEAGGTITQEAFIGYDICSVGIVSTDNVGTPIYTPIPVTAYDSETGTITVGKAILGGTALTIDVYKSGEFTQTLTNQQIDILANCILNAYEHRFDNNVLERTAKIRDGGFSTVSEASTTQANTARQRLLDEELNDMLRAYEQQMAYMAVAHRIPKY